MANFLYYIDLILPKDMTKKEFEDWIQSAKGDLIDFDNCIERGDFHKGLYYLQQSSEKTAKASMIAISFSTEENTETVRILNTIGIQIKPPIKYGHRWRRGFINQLDKFRTNPLFIPLIDILRKHGLKNPQTTVHNAKVVEDLKNPKENEIVTIISKSNSLLDEFSSSEFKTKINDTIAQERPNIDKLTSLVKGKINVDEILDALMIDIGDMAVIGALLLLSTLLTPFEQNRFPGNEKKDKPLIRWIDDVRNLIKRCLDIVRMPSYFE